MLNLSQQHIEQIRGYFIATSDEEKSSLQKGITSLFLKGFLTDLRKIFIYEPNNAEKLLSIGKSMGASEHIEALKEIQQQYYSHIAGIYLKGYNNEDIEQLLTSNNQSFLSEVSFQKELQFAFILNEREQLKKKFQEMDKADEISPAEIEDAFKHIERTRLKEYFKELDKLDEGALMVAEPIMEYENKPVASEALTAVYNFNWKRFAIAAGIVGLIITTTVFVLDKKNTANDLASKNSAKENLRNIIDTNQVQKKHQKKIEETLANNTLKYNALQLPVLKEEVLGFSTKEEKITIQIYDVRERVTVLKQILTTELKSQTDIGSASIVKAIKGQLDSLQSLNNKYLFAGNILSIYGSNERKPTVYKLTGQYYVRIGRSIYVVNKTTAPQIFISVSDKVILDKIDKIEFQQH